LTKDEIIKQLHAASKEFIDYCSTISADKFFHQPEDKWSAAQNVKHLVISANATRPAFNLPKFFIRLYAGKANRPSRSYDELVTKYKLKLQQGGKASGRFIPQAISSQTQKESLLDSFILAMHKLINAIEKKWTDPQLDQYIAPHPLFGKITLRELCYFTIHHTYHHLASIKERVNSWAQDHPLADSDFRPLTSGL
jgi:uncharacterized damage-inducible protein DinB